jgi:hypothetical protein
VFLFPRQREQNPTQSLNQNSFPTMIILSALEGTNRPTGANGEQLADYVDVVDGVDVAELEDEVAGDAELDELDDVVEEVPDVFVSPAGARESVR